MTQVLHKEWPETAARGNRRRGNFDLAVLPPVAIRASSLDQFLEGRIAPCIVIEMGLDYDDGHLIGDHDKLVHSQVPFPYLVHLARDSAYLQREEDAVNQIQTAGAVRIGYAVAVGGKRRVKRIAEETITEHSG
jgi:hypothetical protein